MRDHGIDQAVRPAVGDVAVVEAVVEEVVRVVAQPEVQLGIRPRPRAARLGVRVYHARHLGGEQRAVAEPPAGRSGVGGRDKIRVRPERPLAREVEHLRAQRGQAATVGRDRIGRGVEPVEELPHRGQRLGVVAGGLGVADPDSEQHPAGKVPVELGEVAGHLGGIALPDVEDPGGRGQPGRRLQQRPQRRQLLGAAKPERAEAELLDQARCFARVLLAELPI